MITFEAPVKTNIIILSMLCMKNDSPLEAVMQRQEGSLVEVSLRAWRAHVLAGCHTLQFSKIIIVIKYVWTKSNNALC